MSYQRRSVDVEQLFSIILRDHLQEYASVFDVLDMQVMSQNDVDAIDQVPFVVVTASNGFMLDGPNAWQWDVYVSLVAATRDDAADLADMVWVGMHESHDKNTQIPFVGAVNSVEDINMPSKTSTTLTPAGDLTQYDGSFRVVVRKI